MKKLYHCRVVVSYLKHGFIVSCFSTFIWAETVTLSAIDIYGTAQTTGSVVLSKSDALETNSITLQERLNNDVSFSVVPDSKGEEAISFRGLLFKATGYVEDGIPLYRNSNGFTDPKFTMTNSELQVNDGSGVSPLGVSPMGGEVQIKSKNPSRAFESSLATSISNNDEYYHVYVGSMVDNVYFKADANYYHRSDYELSDDYESTLLQPGGKRINSDKDQKNIAIKSGVFIDEQIHLAAKISVTRAEYGVPPNVHTDINDPVWDAYARIDRKDLNSYYLYGDYNTDDLELSIRAYYDEYEDLYRIYNEHEYQTNWPPVTYEDNRLGTVIKGIKKYGTHKSTFILQAEENEHTRSGGDLAKALYQVNTFKLSLLDEWAFSNLWHLEGGVSYTLMQSKEASDGSALEPPEDKDALNAQLKVIYGDEQGMMYGSIAHKSRMPSMSEMFTFFPWVNANPDLKPETSMQYSVGYQQDLIEKTLIDLSLYYYDIDDLILYRNNGYINREEAENYGMEIRLNSTYFDKNKLRFSYAYTHTSDSEGEALEFIPLHQFRIEDTISISKHLNAYLSYQYMGSRYSLDSATYTDEQYKLSDYHLLDVQVAYQLSKASDWRIGIKNILDESYEWRYGYPAQGRSYYFSFEWKI